MAPERALPVYLNDFRVPGWCRQSITSMSSRRCPPKSRRLIRVTGQAAPESDEYIASTESLDVEVAGGVDEGARAPHSKAIM